MDSSRFIDTLRETRDRGLPLITSYDARNDTIEVWGITFLEDAEGDDLLCMLSIAAVMPCTYQLHIRFRRKTRETAKKFLCFLIDELDRNGFDSNEVCYHCEKNEGALLIPLFTIEDSKKMRESFELTRVLR